MAYQSNFSTLQHLLQLAYSEDPEKQQKSAMDLAKLVDGTPFPAVSFAPLTHALCKLIPSQNRTVASYAARAMKMLLLDDALRPQAATLVPKVLCAAIIYWEDEILCLRELLSGLQTLCWDKTCVKHVLSYPNIIAALFDHAQCTDQEVSVLSLATLANIFVFVDTTILFTAEQGLIDEIGKSIPILVEIIKSSKSRPQKFYATAAVANVSAHPVFKGVLKSCGALEQMKLIEKQSFANMHLIGSMISDCSQTAIYRITEGASSESIDPRFSSMKYSFKWGTKPVMELSLASLSGMCGKADTDGGNISKIVYSCFGIWLLIVLYLFIPIFK